MTSMVESNLQTCITDKQAMFNNDINLLSRSTDGSTTLHHPQSVKSVKCSRHKACRSRLHRTRARQHGSITRLALQELFLTDDRVCSDLISTEQYIASYHIKTTFFHFCSTLYSLPLYRKVPG